MRETVRDLRTNLYEIINQLNGKRYVGVTSRPLEKRLMAHISSAKRHDQKNSTLHRSMRKNGKDVFSIRLLAVFDSFGAALDAECKEIARTKPEYNCTAGGDGATGYRHTECALQKMSDKKKGTKLWLGRRHSHESLRRMSAAHMGQPGFWKGKKLLPHVVEAIRERSVARPDKARVLAMGPKSQSRPIVCLNDGLHFESCRAAAANYKVCASAISTVCKKNTNRKTAGGRVFRYFGDHHGGQQEASLVNATKLQTLRASAQYARNKRKSDLLMPPAGK